MHLRGNFLIVEQEMERVTCPSTADFFAAQEVEAKVRRLFDEFGW